VKKLPSPFTLASLLAVGCIAIIAISFAQNSSAGAFFSAMKAHPTTVGQR